MEWVVTTGKTVEEAKESALDQLGVDAQEAEFEVLEEPKTGLFGRVRGEARVRARILPAQPRPKVERRDRRGKTTRGKNGAGGDAAPRPARGAKKAGARPPKAPATGRDEPPAAADEPEAAAATEGGRTRAPAKKARARSGGASRTRADAAPEGSNSETDAAPTAPTEGNEMTGNDVTVAEQADLTTTFLSGLIDAFGLDGTIEREIIDEDTIEVKVVGDDLGLLIGPKGQTLVAVQELSRTYVQRKATGTHFGRVRIDVGGYRARRREALERFTNQVAEQVVASGIQKALEPMAASDRKVVHDTANGIAGVRTISEGEEPRRRVVIAPE